MALIGHVWSRGRHEAVQVDEFPGQAFWGYEFRKTGSYVATKDGLQLYSYARADGTFDYDKYREAQITGNYKKLDNVWVSEENVEFLANYIRETVGDVRFGICHGTRRGKEQEWFIKYLGCDVIGTEISDTAEQFPNTIQWDFHDVKPEWIDSTDFIYSNSLDHSYDPEKRLNAWMSCVTPRGVCIRSIRRATNARTNSTRSAPTCLRCPTSSSPGARASTSSARSSMRRRRRTLFATSSTL